MHSLVRRSKTKYAPSALAEAVEGILEGTVQTRANPESEATEVSFPDVEAIARFRARGRRIR